MRRDESRHIAYGIFLLSRLIAEHGDEVWDTINRRMGELLPLALAIVTEVFDRYDEMPFGLELDEFVGFANSQFASRLARLERARSQTVDDILGDD